MGTMPLSPSTLFRSLLLAIALSAASMAAAIAQTAPDDGLQDRLAACNACHGKHGEGIGGAEYYPHLAGKPAGYLADQLQAFRDGRRHHAQMNWLLRNAGDAWITDIANHYAAMPPKTRADDASLRLDPTVATRARNLVEHGDPNRNVPACTACHGRDLTGLAPGVPALVGLPAEYVVAQFGAWRTGVRTARAPDCMADIARALDPADVRILATWLAAQGHTEPHPPAAQGSFALPRACGTLPVTDAAATTTEPTP